MNPDRLCAWSEQIGIFGGRPELSTSLSPTVDNFINRRKIKRFRFIPCATMRYIPSPQDFVKNASEQDFTAAERCRQRL
jgi:hypothetical protein